MFVGDMCSDLDIQSNILFGVFLNYWIISFLNTHAHTDTHTHIETLIHSQIDAHSYTHI